MGRHGQGLVSATDQIRRNRRRLIAPRILEVWGNDLGAVEITTIGIDGSVFEKYPHFLAKDDGCTDRDLG